MLRYESSSPLSCGLLVALQGLVEIVRVGVEFGPFRRIFVGTAERQIDVEFFAVTQDLQFDSGAGFGKFLSHGSHRRVFRGLAVERQHAVSNLKTTADRRTVRFQTDDQKQIRVAIGQNQTAGIGWDSQWPFRFQRLEPDFAFRKIDRCVEAINVVSSRTVLTYDILRNVPLNVFH